MTHYVKTSDAAHGKWKGVLKRLGVPESFLSGKAGPCPICNAGTDRFTFDNKGGNGSFICRKCGAGDGMAFAEKFTGMGFLEVAKRIDAILGNETVDSDPARRPDMGEEDRRAFLRQVAAMSVPIKSGDPVDRYLHGRGLGEVNPEAYPSCLRFVPALKDGAGGVRPCMVASVRGADGKGATLHRTYLTVDGRKAEMEAPRKLMPGGIPEGGAVRLGEFNGGPLGVAEGIETAMSAAILFEMPVWALISTANMVKFTPPEGCDELAIFGDADTKFGGEAAAYSLAHRIAVRSEMEVSVHLPPVRGQDWNDVLLATLKQDTAA